LGGMLKSTRCNPQRKIFENCMGEKIY